MPATAAPILYGPFAQLLTFRGLPLKGALKDDALEIIAGAGIVVQNGKVLAVGGFPDLKARFPQAAHRERRGVALPGLVDCHTHLCFAGSRARDYALRLAGKSYLEIAQAGGGIWDTVTKTRQATEAELVEGLKARLSQTHARGITTVEIKSGYGLGVDEELKMLRAIRTAASGQPVSVVATCLAAHIVPKDYSEGEAAYLDLVVRELLPRIKDDGLACRVDAFIEKTAFSPRIAKNYLLQAKAMGFGLTVHADQFTPGSSLIAVECGARSADHLEASTEAEIAALAAADTVAVALPGASIGLGEPLTPARRLLDAGACLAIASDWNPGSAPGGNLVAQAAALAAYQKLSMAEVLAGLTFRAAHALGLDKGRLIEGAPAEIISFEEIADWREIVYQQGTLMPSAL